MAGSILCHCGATFAPVKGRANKFCSIECYRVNQRSGAYKRGHGPEFPRAPCANCGNVVARTPSRRRNGAVADRVYCNRACYDEHRSKLREERKRSCDHCGKSFVPKKEATRFCSGVCQLAERKAKAKRCLSCKCLFTPVKYVPARGSFISYNAGKLCSSACHIQWIKSNPERKRKIGDAFRGEKHPNWQGGKTLLNNVSARGPNWQRQRSAALKRDGFKCVDCGITQDECRSKYGKGLDVDHIIPFHNFSNYRKANSVGNLQSRCPSCHRIEEAKRSMVQMVLPIQDSVSRRHKGRTYGERHNTAKLKNEQVLLMRALSRSGVSMKELSRRFGVSVSAVHSIITGKTWRHLTLEVKAGLD